MRITVLAFLGLAAFSGGVGAAELEADLDKFIPPAMAAWNLPGLAIAVVKDDQVVLARGYGVRVAGKSEPVDAETIFAIGSTSKAFTAAAIGILVDRKKLAWDDRVTTHWPEFAMSDPWVTREIRVSDLLANHSGLSEISEALWYGSGLDREQIIDRLAEVPITQGFRYQFQYRNVMFLTAGELIPRVTGTSWDEFIATEIFRPLGMDNSRPTEAGIEKMLNVASPHVIDYAGEPVTVPYRAMHNIAPAGGIISSVTDLAKWVRLLLGAGTFGGKEILDPATLAVIQRSQTPLAGGPPGHTPLPPVELAAYCLSWVTESYRGERIVWHNGGIDGMSAWVGFVPDRQLGVVVLSNLDECDLRRAVFYRIVDLDAGREPGDLNPQLVAKNTAALQLRNAAEAQWVALGEKPAPPSLPLAAYTGTFTDPAFGEVTVRIEGGGLVFHRSAGHVFDLRCVNDDTFLGKFRNAAEDLREGKETVSFTVAGDKVSGFTDGPLFFTRVAE